MATDHEYWEYVQGLNRTELLSLYDSIEADTKPAGFGPAAYHRGRAFEFLVVRGFELDLESCGIREARVVWPFRLSQTEVAGQASGGRDAEQIDGGVHLPGLSCLFEAKSSGEVGPAAIKELAAELLRRPSGVIGSVISREGFTPAAELLARFLSPITVLLWYGDDVCWCLANPKLGGFVEALRWKYRQVVDRGVPAVQVKERDDARPFCDRVPRE